jgi:hypothetical protein
MVIASSQPVRPYAQFVVRTALLASAALLGAFAPAAFAHHPGARPAGNQVPPVAAAAAIETPCPGDAIAPDRVVTGSFGRDLMRSYVFVPFDVPAGTTAVRVKYCYDQPDINPDVKHTLDLGLYEPRRDGLGPWGPDEFRGWGGSSHPDVTVSPEGFSSEAQYKAKPKGHVPGKTTRGFRPGPISAGRWAVELGVGAVVSQTEGDSDGMVAWRVEIDLSSDPPGEAYKAVPYPRKPVKRGAGWYAGDVHVHGEHSALGDATMTELFDFAFKPRPEGAGLDWLTLSDYVSGSSWGEIGRYQPRYPGKLIVRSAEVITYRGHLNSHGNSTNMDYRTGPLYERRDDGAITQVRDATDPSSTFDRIHASGGFTQINHPTIFPSVPISENLCRGCPWDYSDGDTEYGKVDAWEVHTGPAGTNTPGPYRPGPNPFTLTAIERWDGLRRAGHRVTAVAASDSHNAGRTPNAVTQAPIGQGTTVVYADELSEEGVQRAFQLGHAFVKLWAADDPDLRLEAVTADGVKAMMGDPLRATAAKFTARVLNGPKDGQQRQLIVMRDGEPMATVPVTSDDFTHEFEADGAGDYRLQLQRGNAIDALTNPITLGASPLAMRARVKPARTRARRRARRFTFHVRLRAQDREMPLAGAVVRFAGRRAKTGPTGRATISRRFRRPGRRRATVTKPGLDRVRIAVRVRR